MTDKPRVSPSQASDWIGCQRYWSYRRRHKTPQKESAAFGSRTHDILEGWLKDGVPPDPRTAEGKCATAGLHHLPLPKTAVAVEKKWEFEHGGITYNGRADFLAWHYPGYSVVVGDHKTTKDLKYVPMPHKFAWDPQRILYSRWAVQELKVEFVTAYWVYYKKSGTGSDTLPFTEHRSHIEARFNLLHERVGLPIVRAKSLEPEQLPRNLQHCGAFGGCPYIQECHKGLSPLELLAQIREKR